MNQSDYVASILNDINTKTTKAQPTKQRLASRSKKGKSTPSKFSLNNNIQDKNIIKANSEDHIEEKWNLIKKSIQFEGDSTDKSTFEPAFLAVESLCHSKCSTEELCDTFHKIISDFAYHQLQKVQSSSTFDDFLNKSNSLKIMASNVTAIFAPFEYSILKPYSVYQILRDTFHTFEERFKVIPYVTKGYKKAREDMNNNSDCESLVLLLSYVVELLSIPEEIAEQLIKDQQEYYSQITKSKECDQFVKWANKCENIENKLFSVLPNNPKIVEFIKDAIYGEFLPSEIQNYSHQIIQNSDFDVLYNLEQMCSYKESLTKELENSLSIEVCQNALLCFEKDDKQIVESLINQITSLNFGIEKCKILKKSKISFNNSINSSERSLPFLLADYIDKSVRNRNIDYSKIISLFKEVRDADLFLSFHRRLVAFRVVDGFGSLDRPLISELIPLIGGAAEELIDVLDDSFRWDLRFSNFNTNLLNFRISVLPKELYPEFPIFAAELPTEILELRKAAESEFSKEGKKVEWSFAAEIISCQIGSLCVTGSSLLISALYLIYQNKEVPKEMSEELSALIESGVVNDGKIIESGNFIFSRSALILPKERSEEVEAEASYIRQNRAICAVSRACKKLRRATKESIAKEANVGEEFENALEKCISIGIVEEDEDGTLVFY